jgi:hypothetical protein
MPTKKIESDLYLTKPIRVGAFKGVLDLALGTAAAASDQSGKGTSPC